MIRFLFGLLLGVVCAYVVLFYQRPPSFLAPITVGRLLDRDTIYVKDGGILQGWIREESEKDLLIETDRGTFRMPREQCLKVERDSWARYVRDAF